MEGTKGEAQREICVVLGQGSSPLSIHTFFVTLLSLFTVSFEFVDINAAFALFLQKKASIKRRFVKYVFSHYKAKVSNLNFDDAVRSTKIINQYVTESTNGLVKDVVSPSAIPPRTRCLLVSTLHFKGKWRFPFEPELTETRLFHGLGGDREEYFMKHFDVIDFLCSMDSDLTAFKLVYEDQAFSMLVLKPSGDFGHFKSNLSAEKLKSIVDGLEKTSRALLLPKWRSESSMNAVNGLKGMGIQSMFNEMAANLTGMSDKERLYVDGILQKAMIEVNEWGTTAAAVTTTCSAISRGALPPVIIDSPFLYLILREEVPLFIGQYL